MRRKIETVLLAMLVTACGGGEKTTGFPQIDMNAVYPEKEICLQDIAEVSYIPLETTDESVFYGNIESVSDKGIVGVGDDKIYLFHPDGKVRRIIDRKGEGPGEYPVVYNAGVDWDREEIYVCVSLRKTIMVYSLSGEFKRELPIGFSPRNSEIHSNDAGQFVFFKGNSEPSEVQGEIVPYRPYMLVSKEDGKVDSLQMLRDYHVSVAITGAETIFGYSTVYVSYAAIKDMGQDVYLNDDSSDTIYSLKGSEAEPILVRTPSVRSDNAGKYFLHLQGILPRYHYLRFQAREMALGDHLGGNNFGTKDEVSYEVLHDKRSGEVFRPIFKNNDYPDSENDEIIFSGCEKHVGFMTFEAMDLIEALENNELSGELKTIAEGLTEDDNFVLMVMKFK